MKPRVVVVGAGMGGLAAALRLRHLGFEVRVIEARAEAGGLASGLEADGLAFDGGPYILLDRPGLEWAFNTLGLDLAEQVALRRVEEVYEVASADHVLRFHADLAETAAGFDGIWPGAGLRYTDLVGWAQQAHRRLQPALFVSRPGLREVLRGGAWREAALLLRSLGSVLGRTGLPRPVVEAIAIWTHVAGQRLENAPAFMAFLPALIHGVGAFYPTGGLASVPQALDRAVAAAGIALERGAKVRAIRCSNSRVTGVETDEGFALADAVVSNAGGVGTYLDLVQPTPPGVRARLEALPLQSPGVCAYLAVRGNPRPPYLRFSLPGEVKTAGSSSHPRS